MSFMHRRPWTCRLIALAALYVVVDVVETYSWLPNSLHLPKPIFSVFFTSWLWLDFFTPNQGAHLVINANIYERIPRHRALRELVEMSLFLAMAFPLAMIIGPKLDAIRDRSGWRRALLAYIGVTLVLDIPPAIYAFWPELKSLCN